ncbi:MAG: biotin transporter BioY [Sedimentisphaerales bacterium]|nr:biotin transporter BioY [Sedimentisphaerales bacterium]
MAAGTMVVAEVFRPGAKAAGRIYDIVLVFAAAQLIALSAQISFWVGPVPITGQTFAVLILAALLGSGRAVSSVLLYLAEGAIGMPVFAGGAAGIAWMAGLTGGYLAGFVVAAYVVGYLAKAGWDRKFITTIACMLIGNLIIYICGVAWLMVLFFSAKLSGDLQSILTKGALIFIPGDIFKIVLAACLLPIGWRLISK